MKNALLGLIAGLLLMLGGSFFASHVQTSDGVTVEDVRIPLQDGSELSAYLYTPETATAANLAPGILAVHGYINSRETQSSFAIEFARRGFVVLALDQSGHGYSTNTAFAAGFGGPAGLAYLRSLPNVDTSRIGLEGHSMGGWTSLAAAMAMPDAYNSVALVGSSTGAPFAAPGTTDWPRNLAVIFSTYDEFSTLMWEVGLAADVADSEKLQSVFGTDETVVPRQLYGDIEAGTARWLTQPNTTHPGDHLSFEATADAVTWMDMTLGAPNMLAVDNQVWHLKEAGTLIALIGAAMFAISLFSALNRVIAFAPSGAVEQSGNGLFVLIAILVGAALPAVLFFPLTSLGEHIPNLGIFRQNITTQIMAWALGNGLIAGLGLLISRQFGFTLSPGGLISALITFGVLFGISAAISNPLLVDFRFFVVALKPMGSHHWPIFAAYLLPFFMFFYLSNAAATNLFKGYKSFLTQFSVAWLLSAAGITVLMAGVYGYLFTNGKLPAFADPLFSIVGMQFVPVLTFTALITVASWRSARAVLPGALLSALIITWYIVAGQATHI
ncbi:alpha/beta fold hydrolase [Ponticaulis sp.]|uniref:alpha/beta fold hydrolase n=1 Tax=Ponticaulis sp. TaxID=2020902 RepID=UPI000B682813|nr:alpha/beta fold hydrolase [Ponticaulis sp.]MAJ07631.1 alpha/beta hydrolase [Ponticaulis sp.]RPG17860.1 MAG: alpha/beta fold hydrolase [Hyphomonadaceae bacterium TMED125]